MSSRRDPKGIPAQKRARRAARVASLAAIVADIEADAVLDAQHEGFRLAQSAVLQMKEGRTEAEQRLIVEVYQALERQRRDLTVAIRERLADGRESRREHGDGN